MLSRQLEREISFSKILEQEFENEIFNELITIGVEEYHNDECCMFLTKNPDKERTFLDVQQKGARIFWAN